METRKHGTYPRLKGWDYSSPGCYFLTFCTHGRRCILGRVVSPESPLEGARMSHTFTGRTCAEVVTSTFASLPGVVLESFAVMPNHVHILCRLDPETAGLDGSHASVVKTVATIKALVTRALREKGYKGPVWQRGFHDHIVRDQKDFDKIREYIENNPAKWADDKYYTATPQAQWGWGEF